MPGINLSQSAAQKVEAGGGSSFGRGFLSLIVILSLTILVWIGIVVFDRKLTREVEDLSFQSASIRSELSVGVSGEDSVARVADFQHRVDTVNKESSSSQMPEELLRPFENAMISGVVLSNYVFDKGKGLIVIEGISDNLSLLAQEMVILKKSALVSSVSVDEVSREKDGKMKFSASVTLQGIEK